MRSFLLLSLLALAFGRFGDNMNNTNPCVAPAVPCVQTHDPRDNTCLYGSFCFEDSGNSSTTSCQFFSHDLGCGAECDPNHTSPTDCEYGYRCDNSTGMGFTCEFAGASSCECMDHEDCGNGNCVNGQCSDSGIGILRYGSVCANNTDCASNTCTTGVCIGLAVNSTCSDTLACAAGLYCSGDQHHEGYCLPTVAAGGACQVMGERHDRDNCASGAICDSGVCAALFSKAVGTTCNTTMSCGLGLACRSSATNNVTVCTQPPAVDACPADVDVTGQQFCPFLQSCSCTNGTSICSGPSFSCCVAPWAAFVACLTVHQLDIDYALRFPPNQLGVNGVADLCAAEYGALACNSACQVAPLMGANVASYFNCSVTPATLIPSTHYCANSACPATQMVYNTTSCAAPISGSASKFNYVLYVVVPVIGAVFVAFVLGVCCCRKKNTATEDMAYADLGTGGR